MGARTEHEVTPAASRTTTERVSDRELVFTRTINGPARLVFKAWTTPELFQRWWVPKSLGMTIVFYKADIRTGGSYRIEIRHPDFDHPMPFFGRYVEVTPHSRLVWTNEESPDGAVSAVTFEEKSGKTLVVLRDTYPSKEALDAAMASGSAYGVGDEQFDQLEDVLRALPPSTKS